MKIYNDNNPSNSSNHEKPKFWQKYKTNNQDSSNDTQNAKPIFNLSGNIAKANLVTNPTIAKQNVGPNDLQIDNPNKKNDTWTKKFPYFTQNNHRKFTPLGQSYESALKELLAENLITLPDTQGFEPKVKSSWWNEAHYCDFHQCKGHLTSSYTTET